LQVLFQLIAIFKEIMIFFRIFRSQFFEIFRKKICSKIFEKGHGLPKFLGNCSLKQCNQNVSPLKFWDPLCSCMNVLTLAIIVMIPQVLTMIPNAAKRTAGPFLVDSRGPSSSRM
jgi:hypothetical protein